MLPSSNFGTPIWMATLAWSWPLSPPWPHLPAALAHPWASFPRAPFPWATHSREVAVVVPIYSWGGTRQAHWFPPSNSTSRPRARARALGSLFLKWQSLLNIHGFQTFFQPSFLPTIYSVFSFLQTFSIQRNPTQDGSNTDVRLTLLMVLQRGQAILCTLSASSWLRPCKLVTSPDHPMCWSHYHFTPFRSVCTIWNYLRWGFTFLSPSTGLSAPQRTDITVLFPALFPLPGTEQKVAHKFYLSEWMIKGKSPPTTCLKCLFKIRRNTIRKYCLVLWMMMTVYQLQDSGQVTQPPHVSISSFGKQGNNAYLIALVWGLKS